MRILFLTLYYPPLNTIAAHRVKAFVDLFQKQGVICDVITRYYDEEQRKGLNMLAGSHSADGMTGAYHREENVIYTNFDSDNRVLKISRRIPKGLKGIYNYYKIDVYHYGWLKYVFEAYRNEFKNNKYDFIIPSYGPPIVLLAAKKLSKKYNVPVIADFRDIYIDESTQGGHLFLKKIVQHYLLKKTAGLSFASQGMKDYFLHHSKLKNIPAEIIYNGTLLINAEEYNIVDEKTVDAFFKLKKQYDLLLLYPGTLYDGQNISFFVDGIKKINDNAQLKIGLLFLGWAENNFEIKWDCDFISFLPRVSYQTSMYLQKRASALLWPVRDGYYTGFSGKIFEYIASENFVLISPNPHKDLDYFFKESKNIYILNSENELEQVLKDIHYNKIKIALIGNKEILKREYWAEKLLNFVRSIKFNDIHNR